MQQWEKIPFVGMNLCTTHSMVSYFSYGRILHNFARSINILYGTSALSCCISFQSLLVLICREVLLTPLAPFEEQRGDPGDSGGGGCPLPITPSEAALGSVLSVPLAAAPSQKGPAGEEVAFVQWVPHAPSWRWGCTSGVISGFNGTDLCLCRSQVCAELV